MPMRSLMRSKLFSLLVGALAITLLAACGGSSPTEVPPTEIPTLAPLPTQAAVTPPTPVAPPTLAPTDTPAPEPTATLATSTTSTPTVDVTPTTSLTSTAAVTTTEAVTTVQTVTNTATTTATTHLTSTASVTATVAPRIFFLQPTDNAIIPVTSTIIMGYTGLTVAPAGEVKPGVGHMHLLIDSDFIPAGETIPKDAHHLHFGNGQITTTLVLTPGLHTLGLQFADGAHVALASDQYRATVVVNVVEGAPAQSVRFVTPTDGATVPPQFPVVMAASGLIIEPAGEIHENAGHFHILVDTDFVPPGEVAIKDEQHLHYGKGQITTTLTLTPGLHTLRLQYANGGHIALEGQQYQDKITVTVASGAPAHQVMFVEPRDGAIVTTTVQVKMAVAGLILEPAGPLSRPDAGHLHLLVDSDFVAAGQGIPKDDQHLHLGKGQRAATVTLTPGEHTLRLQMADGNHIALAGDEYRATIKVTVQ